MNRHHPYGGYDGAGNDGGGGGGKRTRTRNRGNKQGNDRQQQQQEQFQQQYGPPGAYQQQPPGVGPGGYGPPPMGGADPYGMPQTNQFAGGPSRNPYAYGAPGPGNGAVAPPNSGGPGRGGYAPGFPPQGGPFAVGQGYNAYGPGPSQGGQGALPGMQQYPMPPPQPGYPGMMSADPYGQQQQQHAQAPYPPPGPMPGPAANGFDPYGRPQLSPAMGGGFGPGPGPGPGLGQGVQGPPPQGGYGGGPPGFRAQVPLPPQQMPAANNDGGGGGSRRKGGKNRGKPAGNGAVGPAARSEEAGLNDERGKSEKPCRTLFLRNIDFEVDSTEVQARFRAFGEIKTFFDLVRKRGLAFVTYFDIRDAERAKQTMQSFEFNGRRIDIHYSFPKEEDQAKRCDREKNQGTLFIMLRKGVRDLTDADVVQQFGHFGEIRSVRTFKEQGHSRFLEFFDSRAAVAANDTLNGAPFLGGEWDLKFAWDLATVQPYGGGGGHGHPAPPPQQQQSPQAMPPQRGGPSFAPPQQAAPFNQAFGPAPGPGGAPPQKNGAYPGSPPRPGVAAQADTNRLEQAQKVQQLLASLKGLTGDAGLTTAAPPSSSGQTSASGPPAAAAAAQLNQPHTSFAAAAPASAAPALPANLAALLGTLQPPK